MTDEEQARDIAIDLASFFREDLTERRKNQAVNEINKATAAITELLRKAEVKLLGQLKKLVRSDGRLPEDEIDAEIKARSHNGGE